MIARLLVSLRMAWRFFSARSRRTLNVLYMLASTVGVLTLLTVLGVVNSLQQDIVDNLIRYRSFHVQVRGSGDAWAEEREEIATRESVVSATPFLDITALAKEFHRTQGFTLRAVPDNYFLTRNIWDEETVFFSRAFDEGDSIVLTRSAAHLLDKRIEEDISLLLIPAGRDERVLQKEFQVAGIVEGSRHAQDLVFGYIRLAALPFSSSPALGVMLEDAHDSVGFSAALENKSLKVDNWQQLNRDILNALRVEKLFLIFFVALIFLVMGFNSYQLFRRAVLERSQALALFRAVGVAPMQIRRMFSTEGFIVGGLSGLVGSCCGLLIVTNLSAVASLINRLLEELSYAFSLLFSFLGASFPRWSLLPWIQQRGMISFWEVCGVFFISCMVPYLAARLATAELESRSPADIVRSLR